MHHSFLTLVLGTTGGAWLTSRPGHFTPRYVPWYPSSRWLGGPERWFGCLGEKNPVPTGIRTPDHLAHSLVAIPTTLLWLQKYAVSTDNDAAMNTYHTQRKGCVNMC
jgi:hypothetical protein